jgi:hypothetical protein
MGALKILKASPEARKGLPEARKCFCTLKRTFDMLEVAFATLKGAFEIVKGCLCNFKVPEGERRGAFEILKDALKDSRRTIELQVVVQTWSLEAPESTRAKAQLDLNKCPASVT